MNKDEARLAVIGAISMALKTPTLQQGFESICKELEAERQLNKEIKARFVKCNTCTDEMKEKCLMFSEDLCQGERCEELVDLMGLISKSDLQKENEELKEKLKNLASVAEVRLANWQKYEKENAELKKQNKILSKALNLYINWADECGIAWDNFPDMTEKWYKIVEEKGLGWIAGLTFMVMEEAKEQLASEVEK